MNEKDFAAAYQPLFDFMFREYGETLLKSEMDDIIEAVDTVNENLREIWRVKCDVEGCDETSANGGGHYREDGYICLCSKHSSDARANKPKPIFKQEAIEREKTRLPSGELPY